MGAIRTLALLSALTLAACSPVKNPDVEALKGLSPEQKNTLTIWLSKNGSLRPAQDQDCDCDEDIDEIRRKGLWDKPIPNYQPYLQTGDFNQDGHPDFAVILKGSYEPERRKFAIFNGGAGRQSSDPAFSMDTNSPSTIYLGQEHALRIGVLFSDNFCELKPAGTTYKADCESGDYG